MKYDSAIKKNPTMLFAATWVDLKMIIPNAVMSNKDKFYMVITYMWHQKKYHK